MPLFLLAPCLALVGCAGRAPQPISLIQANDQTMDCTAIRAEAEDSNRKVAQLAEEQGLKVAQNVAAGVAGLFIPILWFGMDFQGAASKEVEALQARQQYLATLAAQRGCGSAPTTASIGR
jgi:hypothetical protein